LKLNYSGNLKTRNNHKSGILGHPAIFSGWETVMKRGNVRYGLAEKFKHQGAGAVEGSMIIVPALCDEQ
jgi:hypothetical protein